MIRYAFSAVGLLVVSSAVAIGLSFVQWPKSEPAECIYRALEGRYCDEFPADSELTVLGATSEALSSLVIVAGALLSFSIIYAHLRSNARLSLKFWATSACSLFFLLLGVVSFEYHRSHCSFWWRLDINLVRAFPYVLSQTLLFSAVQPVQGLSFPIIGAFFPVLSCCLSVGFLWSNTDSSVGIVAFGVVTYFVALMIATLVSGLSLQYIWLIGGTFSVGGLFIIMQSVTWACVIHPVSVGHTILAFYPLLFAIATSASTLSASTFSKNLGF